MSSSESSSSSASISQLSIDTDKDDSHAVHRLKKKKEKSKPVVDSEDEKSMPAFTSEEEEESEEEEKPIKKKKKKKESAPADQSLSESSDSDEDVYLRQEVTQRLEDRDEERRLAMREAKEEKRKQRDKKHEQQDKLAEEKKKKKKKKSSNGAASKLLDIEAEMSGDGHSDDDFKESPPNSDDERFVMPDDEVTYDTDEEKRRAEKKRQKKKKKEAAAVPSAPTPPTREISLSALMAARQSPSPCDSAMSTNGRTSSAFKNVKGVKLGNGASFTPPPATPSSSANGINLSFSQPPVSSSSSSSSSSAAHAFDPVMATPLPTGPMSESDSSSDGDDNDSQAAASSESDDEQEEEGDNEEDEEKQQTRKSKPSKTSNKPRSSSSSKKKKSSTPSAPARKKPPPVKESENMVYHHGMKFTYEGNLYKISRLGDPQPLVNKNAKPLAYNYALTSEQQITHAYCIEGEGESAQRRYCMFLVRNKYTPHMLNRTQWEGMHKKTPVESRLKPNPLKKLGQAGNLKRIGNMTFLIVHPDKFTSMLNESDRNQVIKAAKESIGVINQKPFEAMVKDFVKIFENPSDLHNLLRIHVAMWKAMEDKETAEEKFNTMIGATSEIALSSVLCFALLSIDKYRKLIPDAMALHDREKELEQSGYIGADVVDVSVSEPKKKPVVAVPPSSSPLPKTEDRASKPKQEDDSSFGDEPSDVPPDWMDS